MARRHRVRLRQQREFPRMQQDRAIRRIARFTNPATWHVKLRSRYVEVMYERFGRIVTFDAQINLKPRLSGLRNVVQAGGKGGVA